MSIGKLVGKWMVLIIAIIILQAYLIEAQNSCTGRTGLNISSGQCVPCAGINCTSCQRNYTFCDVCFKSFGAAPDGTCKNCSTLVSNCIWCWTDYTICKGCADYKGLVNSTYCTTCSDLNCWRCASNYTYCTNCRDGYGAWNGTCLPCNTTNCTSCSANYTSCTACVSGYAV